LPAAIVPPNVRQHGFEISESHVFFRGTCRECRRSQTRTSRTTGKTTEQRMIKSPKGRPKNRSAKRSKKGTP
jgi:hypothetical protein